MRKRIRSYNAPIRVVLKENPKLMEGLTWVNHMASIFTLRAIQATWIFDKVSFEIISKMVGYRDIIRVICSSDELEEFDEDEFYDCETDEELGSIIEKILLRENRSTQKSICRLLVKALENHIDETKEEAENSELEFKFNNLAEILELKYLEKEVLRLLLCKSHFNELNNYLVDTLDIFKVVNRPILTVILNTTENEVSKCLKGKLHTMELIHGSNNEEPYLDDIFFTLLDAPKTLDALTNFVPMQKAILTEEDFFMDKASFLMMKKLLTFDSETPTHILLYGPAGVGKTEFSRTLADAAGLTAFEVIPEINISNHRSNLILADAFVRKQKNAVIIIDEADTLLSEFQFHPIIDNNSIGWLDAFMEKPGSKCIWIMNNPKNLRDTVIRRFAYSVGFPNLGKKERIKIWQTTKRKLDDLGSSLLSDETLTKLASDYQISPGIIGQSFRKSLEASPVDEESLNFYINRQIFAHQKLSGTMSKSIRLANNYSLDGLCCIPSAKVVVDTLTRYKEATKDLPYIKHHGIKILFQGVPGSGKTEFANYLAQSLDMEIIHAHYSDILSPYLGMSEFNLANLFDSAQATNGILCIDEVESLLTTRNHNVEHHYQILINEFLMCLERFNGIFIGTTNRSEIIDVAAMRRYNFKVKFSYLDASARVELFNKMLLPISKNPLTDEEKQYLISISALTPGDFSNVVCMYKSRITTTESNFDLLEALSTEASFRKNGSSSPEGAESYEDRREKPNTSVN
jgi:SpoVK/Ycf46/Vps4 family AAA+-type ATPase